MPGASKNKTKQPGIGIGIGFLFLLVFSLGGLPRREKIEKNKANANPNANAWLLPFSRCSRQFCFYLLACCFYFVEAAWPSCRWSFYLKFQPVWFIPKGSNSVFVSCQSLVIDVTVQPEMSTVLYLVYAKWNAMKDCRGLLQHRLVIEQTMTMCHDTVEHEIP